METICLRCGDIFDSYDRTKNRICSDCRIKNKRVRVGRPNESNSSGYRAYPIFSIIPER